VFPPITGRLHCGHLMASGNSALEHLGKGMITQY
jgi:hypothetical protein